MPGKLPKGFATRPTPRQRSVFFYTRSFSYAWPTLAEALQLRNDRSERGTRVAALFYSLIESAKLCGVEPRAYLREATLRALRSSGTVTLARDLKSPESRGKSALDLRDAKLRL